MLSVSVRVSGSRVLEMSSRAFGCSMELLSSSAQGFGIMVEAVEKDDRLVRGTGALWTGAACNIRWNWSTRAFTAPCCVSFEVLSIVVRLGMTIPR